MHPKTEQRQPKNEQLRAECRRFRHPDDFYDWYRDDFADFEEAEDYYYSHGGR